MRDALATAEADAVVEASTSAPTRSGNIAPHSSACMPPMEPPTTARHRAMPSRSARSAWTRTMSRMVTTGNVEPYGAPVEGSTEAGPVVP